MTSYPAPRIPNGNRTLPVTLLFLLATACDDGTLIGVRPSTDTPGASGAQDLGSGGNDSGWTDHGSAESGAPNGGAQPPPPGVVVACAQRPPDFPVAREVAHEAFPSTVSVGWNDRQDVVGGVGEHVFVFGCGGGQLASGCGVVDLASWRDPSTQVPKLDFPSTRDFPGNRHHAVWGGSAEDFFFPPSFYFDGQTWSSALSLTAGHTFDQISGTSSRNFWLSDSSALFHVEGDTASAVPALGLPGRVTGIQASSEHELWGIQSMIANGTEIGELVRFTAQGWQRPGLVDITSVSASSGENVWAVDGTSIHHFDGSCWVSWVDPRKLAGDATVTLRTVWTRSAADTWVTGDDNLLRHWDGEKWSLIPVDEPEDRAVGGVWGTPTGLWVVLSSSATHRWGATFLPTVSSPTGGP